MGIELAQKRGLKLRSHHLLLPINNCDDHDDGGTRDEQLPHVAVFAQAMETSWSLAFCDEWNNDRKRTNAINNFAQAQNLCLHRTWPRI